MHNFVAAILMSFATSTSSIGPPTGASYGKLMHVPIVGDQHMTLHIQSKSVASIELKGIVNHAETLAYSVYPDNRVQFVLSNDLIRILNRYRCLIEDPYYNQTDDTACITVNVRLLRLRKQLRLTRVRDSKGVGSFLKKLW